MRYDRKTYFNLYSRYQRFYEIHEATDFNLSSKIIPSLLDKVIYSNEIGLKISEIEGDAVLFYRNGELPPFQSLID